MFISAGLMSYHLHTKLGTLTDHQEISRPRKHMSRDNFATEYHGGINNLSLICCYVIIKHKYYRKPMTRAIINTNIV
jgi:hypothetical protein